MRGEWFEDNHSLSIPEWVDVKKWEEKLTIDQLHHCDHGLSWSAQLHLQDAHLKLHSKNRTISCQVNALQVALQICHFDVHGSVWSHCGSFVSLHRLHARQPVWKERKQYYYNQVDLMRYMYRTLTLPLILQVSVNKLLNPGQRRISYQSRPWSGSPLDETSRSRARRRQQLQ